MRTGAGSNLVLSSLVFEYACDAMVLLDSELTVRALNPAAQALLGWRSDEAVGRLDCRALLGCPVERPRPGHDGRTLGACLCERVLLLHRAVEAATLHLRPRGRRLLVVSASCSPLPVDHLGGAVLVLRAGDDEAADEGELCLGELCLNPARHQLQVQGRAVHVTPIEFNLLRYLLTHQGRVVSHQELLERVWRYQVIGDRDLVKSHIASLRHRLRAAGVCRVQIQNVYGVGYTLALLEEGGAPADAPRHVLDDRSHPTPYPRKERTQP
jgi:DNA-binding winged helix-turn-helix (wHTH) protein